MLDFLVGCVMLVMSLNEGINLHLEVKGVCLWDILIVRRHGNPMIVKGEFSFILTISLFMRIFFAVADDDNLSKIGDVTNPFEEDFDLKLDENREV